MRFALFAVALVGCARGGVGQQLTQDDGSVVVDGTDVRDAPAHEYLDAKVYRDAKEYDDAKVYLDAKIYMDAHVYMDACVPVQTELLVNGGFEQNTTGWHEVQFDSELISNHLPQAGTYGAWLGSYDQTASDRLYQDVAIPAGTTALVLTGYRLVGTQETTTTTAYDFSHVGITPTNSTTPIETALTLSNLDATTTTTYTAFSHSFAVAGLAGTTVRFEMDSESDISNLTNFFYDTLSLQATHCP